MTGKTSFAITDNDSRQLRAISTFTGLTQSRIISEFIEDLFRKMKTLIPKSVETGDFLDYQYDINVKAVSDMVLTSFPCAMDEDRSITDAKTMEQLEAGFARLDRQKTENKRIFKECLDQNFPVSEADKAQKIEHFNQTIKLKQALKKADGSVLPDCEVA